MQGFLVHFARPGPREGLESGWVQDIFWALSSQEEFQFGVNDLALMCSHFQGIPPDVRRGNDIGEGQQGVICGGWFDREHIERSSAQLPGAQCSH